MGMNQAGVWNGNPMVAGSTTGLHQPGVLRRGGGRYNSRPGPYDRRGSRHGQGMGGGRLSPVRGMTNMYGGGGRLPSHMGMPYVPPGHPAAAMMMGAGVFPDAMGGAGGAQQGPREAVQGRSLKSYEDLDAVGGAGSGELNY